VSRPNFQIMRRAADVWDVLRLEQLWERAHQYEIIGRIVLEGDRYHVEYPKWEADGYTWERQPRSYTVAKRAMRVVVERERNAS
jgi:hypothetical protein